MEIPLLLMIIGIALAVLLPVLPPLGQKIAITVAMPPVLFALYYMIVIPGWQPNRAGRLRPPWSLIAFVILAALVLLAVGGFRFLA